MTRTRSARNTASPMECVMKSTVFLRSIQMRCSSVFIASRVCRGLSYAHAKRDKEGRLLGIVHRDVNPKNVMLAVEGDVKLTDFGIAKALDLMYNEEGKVIPGKDEYLSPEGASYAVTDGRSDLFSLGDGGAG